MKEKIFTKKIGDVELKVNISDLAENANGSVIVSIEDTSVLITAVANKRETTLDYFPLSVDFEEKFYSKGLILGSSYLRREGRPSKEAVLNGRLIDRTIRPLFPKDFKKEVQVVASCISFGKYNPNMLSLFGASLALGISDIPFNGPVSGANMIRGEKGWSNFVDFETEKISKDKFLVCGKDNKTVMLEMEGDQVDENEITKARDEAHKEISKLNEFQNEIIKSVGKKKMDYNVNSLTEKQIEYFQTDISNDLKTAIFEKDEDEVNGMKKKWIDYCGDELKSIAETYLEESIDKIIHEAAVVENKRVDGRGFDEVRELYAKAGGLSTVLHGSGIFYRGGTHVMTVLTLGGPSDSLSLNTVENPDAEERFFHHYNFPPFSTGETGRIGFTKRREIGHGALAEKALLNVLPNVEEFPYTIRLVSEAFSSNGSTSMASTCASTIALLDGGVKIKNPVAGIAIGLMTVGDKFKILTDIQGPEDHYGDMDFKIAGSKDGITAMQLDVKIEGITSEMFDESIKAAKVAREKILKVIEKEISSPRGSLSSNAPIIKNITIKPDQIGMVIGSGGKTIKKIREDTGVTGIDIEDDGRVSITGTKESTEKAYSIIDDLTKELMVGDRFDGTVTKVAEFGAFVELVPGKEGMVHISEISPTRIDSLRGIIATGDKVPVVIKEIRNDGKYSLSIKDVDPTKFADIKPSKKPSFRKGNRRN